MELISCEYEYPVIQLTQYHKTCATRLVCSKSNAGLCLKISDNAVNYVSDHNIDITNLLAANVDWQKSYVGLIDHFTQNPPKIEFSNGTTMTVALSYNNKTYHYKQ